MQLLVDDVIIIAEGRVVAQGPIASVVGSMAGPARSIVRTDDLPALRAALGPEAEVVVTGDGAAYITGVDAAAIGVAAHRAGIVLEQLISEQPDLEQAFLALTNPATVTP